MRDDEEKAVAPHWAIVEIFGHRRHVGIASEEERFGVKMLRIDVPGPQQHDLRATSGGLRRACMR